MKRVARKKQQNQRKKQPRETTQPTNTRTNQKNQKGAAKLLEDPTRHRRCGPVQSQCSTKSCGGIPKCGTSSGVDTAAAAEQVQPDPVRNQFDEPGPAGAVKTPVTPPRMCILAVTDFKTWRTRSQIWKRSIGRWIGTHHSRLSGRESRRVGASSTASTRYRISVVTMA